MNTIFAENNKPNPKVSANFLSKSLFWWSRDIFWNGKNFDFKINNLYDVLPENESEHLSNQLENFWISELSSARNKKRQPSLWSALIKTYKFTLLQNISLVILSYCIMIIQPDVLKLLVSYFDHTTQTTEFEAYAYATLMVLLMFLQVILFKHGFLGLLQVGLRARIACSSLIYKKIFRLHCSVATQSTIGKVVNLLTMDLSNIEVLFTFLPYYFVIPAQLIIVIYLMWRHVTFTSLIVVFIMLLQIIPAQVLYYKMSLKLRSRLALARDERISLIGEVINGIRTLKMYVWEKSFEKLIYFARGREIKLYIKVSYILGTVTTVILTSHRITIFLLIVMASLSNTTIAIVDVITVNQYMLTLRSTIAYWLSCIMRQTPSAKVSMKRIKEFLLLDETQISKAVVVRETNSLGISINNVIASYEKKLSVAVLEDVSLKINSNMLCIISGSIGSGKSSLIKLILKELDVISGDLYVNGRVSYASQTPWLFNGSVRDNILFGTDFNENKYYKVTKACSLHEDFDQLPYGDKTLVGDKGMTLSGGQQARVNLARAVYREADIYLLDDPFTSVDITVERKIFDNCINGFLAGRTRVIVTHNVEIFSKADLIILIDKGKVKFKGSFQDLQSDNQYLHLSSFEEGVGLKTKVNDNNEIEQLNKFSKNNEYSDKELEEHDEFLVKENVSSTVYWEYVKAGCSKVKLFFVILFLILTALSLSGFDYLSIKTIQHNVRNVLDESTLDGSVSDEIIPDRNTTLPFTYLFHDPLFFGLSSLVIAIVTVPVIFYIVLFITLLICNQHIHDKMFKSIIRTPLRFFEINPAGRILNRFSEDTAAVDDVLPLAIFNSVDLIFVITTVLIPALIVSFWNIIPLSLLVLVCCLLSKGYLHTIQRLRRLVGIAKSPILSFATSTMSGISTIRSCKVDKFVCKTFNTLLNKHTMVYYLNILVGLVFAFWLESMTVLCFASVAYGSIIFKSEDTYSGYVGLSLVQLLEMLMFISFSMKQIIETLSLMTNVERMLQFTKLEPEEKLKCEDNKENIRNWPSLGKIEFSQLNLRYTENNSKLVLKNINLLIEPQMKIGIVGRTGSGKTSLISALFRLAYIDGLLLIDGINIKTISLYSLRTKISIIPQEPILFSTTLRANLDPFNEFDDITIWSALQDVKLNKVFDSLAQIIDSGGSKLSCGQRQLLCLARTIIKKNKIIIMDEATSNIDPITDAMIQEILKIKFKNCTVLVIAHRLNTIMDSDKVLVMDNGQVVEFDYPEILIKKEDGYFSKMVQKTEITKM